MNIRKLSYKSECSLYQFYVSKILLGLMGFMVAIFSLLPLILCGQTKPNAKKLIEFGWDYPKVSFLQKNIHAMQKAPFDGLVFSFDFDIYNAFDPRPFPDSIFQYKELGQISWQKFTDNFLFMRGASYSGAHWLDDNSWKMITQNLEKVSKALAISKAKGIGFDAEYNYADSTLNPWVYKPSLYKNLSYQQVGTYVRKRGKQFMEAVQKFKPDIKILCFWLLGLVYDQNKFRPIENTGMALYPFFVEGMLDGQNNTSEIIDGNESAYWYQKAENFVGSGEYSKIIGTKLIDKSLQSKYQKVSHAQAVFLDGVYAKHKRFDKGFDEETKKNWLINNLYNAYKTSDKYVWFYSERMNWWKNQVDSGLTQLVERVRQRVNAERSRNADNIIGTSSLFDLKKNELQNYQGFSYSYSKSKNTLQVSLLNSDITNLQLYNNSKLIYDISTVPTTTNINLNKIYNKNGTLIIMTRDKKKIASVAYIN